MVLLMTSENCARYRFPLMLGICAIFLWLAPGRGSLPRRLTALDRIHATCATCGHLPGLQRTRMGRTCWA